jgi:hypothetical protein
MEKLSYYFYYNKEYLNNIHVHNIFEKIIKKAKFEKKNIYDKNFDYTLDFFYIYVSLPINFYKIKTRLKNSIISSSIDEKNNLYDLSYKNNKSKTLDYFMETYNSNSKINYKKLFENNQPWYIKLNSGCGGYGNLLVDNYNDFIQITKDIKKHLNIEKKNLKYVALNNNNNFILNKYIINPLLFKEKKFHIRIYFINYINSMNVIKSYLSRYGKILTAKDKYIASDFDNKDIHDSHVKSTETDYIFPNDLEKEYGKTKVNNYFKQIITILQYIKSIQKISNYPETQNGYTIHGCDFMITDDNIVKLLEINGSKTGISFKIIKIANFFGNYLFKNIFNEIVADVFKLEKVPVEEKFIKL